MNSNKTTDDWKVSFKYDIKCCMFGFLYGLISALAFIFFFTTQSIIVLPVCLIILIGAVIWNIKSIRFSIKAPIIELAIAVGIFFTVLILWALTDPKPIIFID